MHAAVAAVLYGRHTALSKSRLRCMDICLRDITQAICGINALNVRLYNRVACMYP
jgi:hypothetical protein